MSLELEDLGYKTNEFEDVEINKVMKKEFQGSKQVALTLGSNGRHACSYTVYVNQGMLFLVKVTTA